MNGGTLLACLIVAAFLAAEVFAFVKAGHRTEPRYIHNLLIETRTAVEFCDSDVSELKERFDQTLDRVTAKLQNQLEQENTSLTPVDVAQIIDQRVRLTQSQLRDSLSAEGCASQSMKNHRVRYRIYAKKSR